MINLDFIGLRFLSKEIENEILNYKISKIIQFDKNSFSIFFSKKQLFFQVNNDDSIFYIKKDKEENTNNFSSSFLLTLKKYFQGSILRKISTINNDRIIEFTFSKVNLTGKIDYFYIIFEIMGKHSNIFLLDEKMNILNLLNNNSTIESKRFYKINTKYLPFSNEKNEMNFDKIYLNSKEMIDNINGIGYLFSNDTYNNLEKRKLFFNNYEAIIFSNDSNYHLTYNKFSKYENFNRTSFLNLNDAINEYFSSFKNVSIINNKKRNIEKFILNSIKKNEKIIKNIEKELEDNKNYEKYREIGDILTSNIYKIKDKISSITLFDFYNNKDITIILDENKNISDNLKIYYNKYRKAKKNVEISNNRLIEIKNKIVYFKSMLNFLLNENDLIGLNEIEYELGILKYEKNNKSNTKKRELLKYIIDDFEILVGRNNIENDFITFNKAKPYDIWLHVRDIPGAHVIIITNKRKVPQNVIYKAASIAASKSKGDFLKIVDYTERKNLKRVDKFGHVTFNTFNSIEV